MMKRKFDFVLKSKNGSIIFEDETIIVIDKPPHLLVLPDRYNQSLPNLYHMLKEEFGEIFVVHRIDKETSGVIVFAKNADAHTALNSQFEDKRVEKTYRTIVVGMPGGTEGKIDAPISESQNHPGVMKVDLKRGKPSVTNYKVIERFDGYALVAVEPESGRMHQIRIHLASAGLPIMCDKIYGDGKPFFLSQVKTRYFSEGEEKPLLSRTALHAESISLFHPTKNERVSFAAELPKDMRSVLNYLRKFKPNISVLNDHSVQTSYGRIVSYHHGSQKKSSLANA
jgi:23S rRNA pseudouridine955/2504/2580 synthase/23S rRNA pseudouridine1911/1915/1917 synthase